MKLRLVALLTPFMLGALAARADTLGRQPVCGVDPATGNCVLMKVATDGTVQVAGSLSVTGAGDTVSTGAPTTFNANSVCTGQLLLAGQQGSGFQLNAGTLAATLTPQYSMEASGSNWTSTQFIDQNGTKTSSLVVTNPNSLFQQGVVTVTGARRVQVCTTAYTSGSATGFADAAFVQGGAAAGGSGSNASVSTTGAAVPASGTYMAGNKSGNLTGISLDGSGNVNVNVAAGGSSSASDVVGNSATLNANNVCATVLLNGRQGAGFEFTNTNLAALLSASYSNDATPASPGCTGGTWNFTRVLYSNSGGSLIYEGSTSIAPATSNFGGMIDTGAGAVCARMCTNGYTSGSGSIFLVATAAAPRTFYLVDGAGNLIATSNGGRLQVDVNGGAFVNHTSAVSPGSVRLTDGAAFYDATKTGQLPAALDGSGFLKTHEQGTATVAGTVTANIGTSGSLALDASVTGLQVSQGSTTSGQKGDLTQGAVTTSAPTYTTGQTSPISLQTDGSLRVAVTAGGGSSASVSTTGSAVPGSADYIGGNKGGNLTGLSLDGSGNLNVNVAAGGASGGTSSSFGAAFPATGTAAGAKVVSSAPTLTAGNMEAPNLTTAGRLIVDSSQVTQPVSGTVTANIGTSGSLALDASVAGLQVSQGSTTSGQKGGLVQGAVTTSAPTYTTGQTDPLSLDTTGNLRTSVNNTVTVTGTVTTTPPANASTNIAQVGGNSVTTLASGEQKVGVEGLAASGASKSGNPVQVGAVFNTTQPTVTTGQVVEAQATARGELLIAKGVSGFSVDNTGFNVNNSPTVNQGGAPWSQNITQVGGTTILTGNGTTGAGSPRVTIASDNTPFTVNAAQSGSWTVDISDRAARLLGVVYGSQGQQLKQTATNFNLQTEIAVGGTLIDPRSIRALTSSDTVTVVQGTGTNLHMVCDSGCTPGGSFADNSTFTAGSTAVNITAGEFNDTPLADVTSGNAASARITKQRALHINLRDSSGNELGGAAAPVFTQESGEQIYFAGQTALIPYAGAVALTSNPAKSICIRNLPQSADFVWVGSSAQVNSATGYPIAPGEEWCRTLSNTNLVFAATLAGASVAFDGTN